MRRNINTPIKNLVMLAALETVPGTKSISLERSALPLALVHVPLASVTNTEIPGNPFLWYLSSKADSAACLGCLLLLSGHGIVSPIALVVPICSFVQERINSSVMIRKQFFFITI